jgi:hypothetical protein
MTQTAEVRDWLSELRIAADADDDGASFQALVVEIVEAGLLSLEARVYEVAAEKWDDGEAKAGGLWAGAVASFFGPSPQPGAAQPKPADDWAAERARREREFAALEAKQKPEAKPEPAKPEPEKVATPKTEPKATGTALVRTTGGLPVVVGTGEPEAIKEVNDKHAVISNLGGKCVVMEWAPSAITPGAKELAYQSFTSFRERYANRYVAIRNGHGRIADVPVAPLWLAHPQRRQYEGLDLVPNGPSVLPGNYLNLWRGWGVDPEKGSWRLLRRHIAEVLANGDQRFEDFIIKRRLGSFKTLDCRLR